VSREEAVVVLHEMLESDELALRPNEREAVIIALQEMEEETP
jgi:hypothetical protein